MARFYCSFITVKYKGSTFIKFVRNVWMGITARFVAREWNKSPLSFVTLGPQYICHDQNWNRSDPCLRISELYSFFCKQIIFTGKNYNYTFVLKNSPFLNWTMISFLATEARVKLFRVDIRLRIEAREIGSEFSPCKQVLTTRFPFPANGSSQRVRKLFLTSFHI